ncbi:hypothetical protein PHLCEN_2v7197 [Hermanssonia centrifuga]|uniref:Uncharacterized protein n=1 Tax=Hermanssonia centrifuga TaxID=98765 RepID=A0A2R6NXT0_9APHY|nr:hypothetical protein PHLCEN_2v7197 [Hermanssonia centrifuga]
MYIVWKGMAMHTMSTWFKAAENLWWMLDSNSVFQSCEGEGNEPLQYIRREHWYVPY